MNVFRLFLPALALCAAASGPVLAQSAGPALVIDASTGAVLHQENASQAWYPASTTKIMTAYVALRAVRAGRIGLETAIPASALAAKQPRVKVYIRPGQDITLDNALKIMMVKSANDIAYVIAEGVAGSVPAFVEMMNAEARRLRLNDTVFRNPNGWHDPEQQSSARDMAILTMTILREFPDYAEYWGIGAVQLGRVTLNNTNGLIGRYSGATGFKTGFVCASGFNVVATATRGGRTLIAVVMGAYSGAERTVKAAQILDAGFASWGGSGYAVTQLPPSGSRARNICADVRAYGRGAPLADDADSMGPISFMPSGNSDSDVVRAGLMPQQPSSALGRSAAGRITLGPRAQFAPLPVAYGRSAGSARAPLAANAGGRAGPALASVGPAPPVARDEAEAVAAPSAARARPGAIAAGMAAGAVAAGAATAFAPARAAEARSEGPIRLHGAIGQGAAAPLRPSAAAGIKPKPAPQAASLAPTAPAGRPQAVRAPQAKPAAPKPRQTTAPAATRAPATLAPRRPSASPAATAE
ncbi:MAG: serine hydrolase [Hyphomicrobiales bacterium]|jgi:D-alanyl-D-alanine carboxypeptidase|nr:serine hydrolase [Hyphomicrobiales bacterium]